MSRSFLINGFPDNSEGFVLQAISDLSNLGYISFTDDQGRYMTYNKCKRKEILAIVDPIPSAAEDHIINQDLKTIDGRTQGYGPSSKKNERNYTTGYEKPSPALVNSGKIIMTVITVLFAFGIIGIVAYTPPTASFDRYSDSANDIGADYQIPEHQSNEFGTYSVGGVTGPSGQHVDLKYTYYPIQCTSIEGRDVHGHPLVLVYEDLCIVRSL
jgi:hypothetical protein